MKRRWLIIPFLTLGLILTFTLLPISFISADTENLVQNGDFSDGSSNWDWNRATFDGATTSLSSGGTTADGDYAWVYQEISTSRKHLIFSFDVYPTAYTGDGSIFAGFNLFDGGFINSAAYDYGQSFPLNTWSSESFAISELWEDQFGTDLPNFDAIGLWVETAPLEIEALFDNIRLTYHEEKEVIWVRTQEMTCKQVWINEDGDFQFSFIYPYADNNWVRIYDLAGNMVYEIDMPYDNPNIIVDLPDGMYNVKTFHDQLEPIQEFVIGKP